MSVQDSIYATARRLMVQSQLLPNKITDEAVLAAMAAVQREVFVPAQRRGVAYQDEDIEVKPGRYLMEPMVLARALQSLELSPGDKVMEIASATGYGAAVMARMVAAVVAVEEDPELAGTCRENLARAGATNSKVVAARLAAGAPELGPYDAILVSGAMSDVPEQVLAQLGERGRLLAIIRASAGGPGVATLYRREGNLVSKRPVFDASCPLLPGFAAASSFVF